MPGISSPTSARLQACPLASGGTPIEAWTGWDHHFAPMNLADCQSITVIAPHPDDETLGLGATLAMLCAAGVDVQLISVTDGGACYSGLDARCRAELEAVRWGEVCRAAKVLGAAEPVRLQMPDGELACHERQLTERIAALLAGCPKGSWCAATWHGDGHPDHEAVGRAAAAAAVHSGAVFVEYPVWMWHWATPGDAAVPWSRVRRVTVTDAARSTKMLAAQYFLSQTQPTRHGDPVLPTVVVDRLLAVGEVVFV